MSKKPTVLMILDGFGLNDNPKANAVYEAKTPNIDRIMAEYPFVKGNASGLAVGLPDGQMGNSEVGHLNMGAGRIVYQELTRITKSIEDGDFFENPAFLEAVRTVRRIIPLFIFTDCFPTVVCTATTPIFMDCWNWPRDRDLQMYVYIVSWTEEILHRHQEKVLWKNWWQRWMRSALARSLPSKAVIMSWTEIPAGSVWRKLMQRWYTEKA